jgi:hypothetical protein
VFTGHPRRLLSLEAVRVAGAVRGSHHAGTRAVALIQVGDVYFVRDGHHRISVARALGQAYIDAKVIVLETET